MNQSMALVICLSTNFPATRGPEAETPLRRGNVIHLSTKLTDPSSVPDLFDGSFLLAQVIGKRQVDEIAHLLGNVILCVKDNSPCAIKFQRCTYFLFELVHHVALAMNKDAVHVLLGADAIDSDCRPALCFTGEVAGGIPFKGLFEGADSGGFRSYVEYEFSQHKEPFSYSGRSFFK
jgi:hypothetical protein